MKMLSQEGFRHVCWRAVERALGLGTQIPIPVGPGIQADRVYEKGRGYPRAVVTVVRSPLWDGTYGFQLSWLQENLLGRYEKAYVVLGLMRDEEAYAIPYRRLAATLQRLGLRHGYQTDLIRFRLQRAEDVKYDITRGELWAGVGLEKYRLVP